MTLPWSVLICLSAVQLCMGDQPVEELITTKKVPLLGGWSEANPESPQVQEAVQHAVTTLNTITRNKKLVKLIAVHKVKIQVTETINYKIEALLARTKCLKADNPDLESCSLTKKRILCNFVVTFDPRNNKHNLEEHTCNIEKNRRGELTF